MYLRSCLLLVLPLVALSAPPPASPAKVLPKDEEWVKPWFCKNDIDCPIFSVVSTNAEYELRNYSHGGWVSTEVLGMDLGVATSVGFNKLFKYISGENDQGAKLDMTAPVLRKIVPGDGPNCENTFTISFYVSYKNQIGTPAPTNPEVFLETKPNMNVYVRSFPGYASTEDILRNAVQLGEAINDSSKFHSEFYYSAGYDDPLQPFNRHNEVWFIATF